MPSLFHLAPIKAIERAARAGQYTPESLSTRGFIHCSYAHQVQQIADTLFHDSADLALLEIDPARVDARIIDGASPGRTEAYPHIYGPLPMSAVLSVRELTRGQDGKWKMPCNVTGVCTCKARE
ncbi:MAG TPA: DUF952 domain-containing protein [Steroidobacteraceae bacterium]